MESPPENDVCSVCHDTFSLPCQANCSHWFCGQCILRVWHHGSAMQPCKCPICRRSVTLLIPDEAEQRQRHDAEASQVLENVEKYNRLFGRGSISLMQRLWDLPFFICRLLRELMDRQRSFPLVFKAQLILSMVLCGIYFLSAVDILPKGPVEFIDDFLILLIVILRLAVIYQCVLRSRHGGN